MELIHNRGRGPEIVGTRITVYNLLPYLLDSTVTEAYVAELYGLTSEQVAAARAYALNYAESVMATHRKIEARIAAGNPPEIVMRGKEVHARFVKYRRWLADRQRAENENRAKAQPSAGEANPFPNFQEWLSQQPHSAEHS